MSPNKIEQAISQFNSLVEKRAELLTQIDGIEKQIVEALNSDKLHKTGTNTAIEPELGLTETISNVFMQNPTKSLGAKEVMATLKKQNYPFNAGSIRAILRQLCNRKKPVLEKTDTRGKFRLKQV